MYTARPQSSSPEVCAAIGKRPVSAGICRGVLVIDSDQTVVAAGRGVFRLLGLPAAAFLGQSLHLLLAQARSLSPQAVARLQRLSQNAPAGMLCPLGVAPGGHVDMDAYIQPLDSGQTAIVIQTAGFGHPPSADRLSGLADRLGLIDALKTALRARKTAQSIALFAIDLERFSWVNDIYGHAQGDSVLRQVASRLLGGIGENDLAARLRGSEFLVMAHVKPDQAALTDYAHNLLSVLGEPCLLDGQPVLVKPVIGVAAAPDHGRDAASLLRAAGLAMRQAGQENAPLRLFQPGMLDDANRRKTLELDLRQAMQRQEFEIYYQPQFSTGSGSLAGFEALLRWNHPDRGLVLPGDFIPLAEELGLITELGEWVLRTACHQAASWPDPLYVSVNVSGLQFEQAALTEQVRDALAEAGLAGSRLEIEVTETALLRQSDDVLDILSALRDMGVRISMDDFGTGYSSLTQLHQFPFDKLKIDRSFVSRIGRGAEGTAIIRAIARMGASLGLRTVAEGVETIEQWDTLRSEGCDEVQGFLLGRPTPVAMLDVFLGQFRLQTA